MIQAIGLSSATRRGRPPAVDDLTFEAHPGQVTVLLGPPGSGKSTALRLLLQLAPGRGVALFRGRPLSQVPHPAREIGALLGDVPGHPRRTAAGHLRMLAAAAGLPPQRAGDVLEVVGLSGLADQRLGRFSRGMDRRLGLAAALLGDPHTLVLDEPALGLSPRETSWLHGLLRGYADQGGAVLITARDPREAARIGDRVVSLRAGRLIADQVAEDFARTRLRPRVLVHTPHADRLAAALAAEFRQAAAGGSRPPVEVVRESGSRLAVYGSSCAAVGEVAYRHRVVVHQLADQLGDSGDRSPAGPLYRADGRPADGASAVGGAGAGSSRPAAGPLPPRIPSLPPPGPSWPLRYELRRWSGVHTCWWIMAAALLAGLAAGIGCAAVGAGRAERALAGWPEPLLLPPVAMAAGLLGALSFGQEFRYPALAPSRVPVPRRLSLLGAKLLVSSAAALLMSWAAVAINSAMLVLLFGGQAGAGGWAAVVCSLALLSVECAWAGVLAAGIFRSTLVGLAAVAALPLALAPALRAVLDSRAGDSLDGLAGRVQSLRTLAIPSGVDRWLFDSVHLASQPIAWALVLSLAVLLCGYALISFRNGLH